MAFSKTWGYAVRALVRLAEDEDHSRRWQSSELAEAAGLPVSYLSKILSSLHSAGLLDSARGRGGGVRLALDPDKIRLSDVAVATGDLPGPSPTEDAMEGAPELLLKELSQRWQPYRRGLIEFLAETTLADLVSNQRV